jgi:UDP-N-acetyl-2-amino-2-deoxyglucuronate dehydrogenase
MAGGHLRSYRQIWRRGRRDFILAATCDPVIERAADFARQAREWQGSECRVYTDLGAMLKDGDLTCVDICAPHGFHHRLGVPCLEAGLDIMVEKPIGVTTRASRLILDAAQKQGRLVAVAENLRRYPGQRCVHWMINEAKMLGEMRMFFTQRAFFGVDDVQSEAMRWRAERVVGGGGLIFDSGAHYMDTVRYLFGDADTVYAQMRTYERRSFEDPERGEVVADVEDSWTAMITFKSGVVGTWTFFPAARGKPFTTIMYYGSLASFEDQSGDVFHGLRADGELTSADGKCRSFKDIQLEYLLSLDPAEKGRLFPLGLTDGVALECYDFIDAVAGRRRPDVDGWDGLRAKAIAEAIYESAWTGRSVRVDDVIELREEEYQSAINEYWGIK